MLAAEIEKLDLAAHFPIRSQTSDRDKAFLLGAIAMAEEARGTFSYLEIGSFLGGSLVPFLRSDACVSVLSIDERGRQQPDERGAKFDYAGITTQTMIDNLHRHDVKTGKLETMTGRSTHCPLESAGMTSPSSTASIRTKGAFAIFYGRCL